MMWPTDVAVLGIVLKASAAFAVALLACRLFRPSLRVRRAVWLICFLVPLWLLVPVPKVRLPILGTPPAPTRPDPYVFELQTGFQPFNVEHVVPKGPESITIALGVAAFLGFAHFLLSAYRTLRLVRSAEQATDANIVAVLYELGHQRNMGDAPILKFSDEIQSPCVWGISQPVILAPTTFRELGADDWRVILGHEISHLSQMDPVRLTLYAVVRSLFWWNPLVLWGHREAVLTQELSVDEQHLETKGYGDLLMRFAVESPGRMGARFIGQGQLLRRLRVVADPSSLKASPVGFLALAAMAPCVVPAELCHRYEPDARRIGHDEITYLSDRTGVGRLWRSSQDGGNPQPMSDRFVQISLPAVSPDGKWIAYAKKTDRDEDILIARVDGSEVRCVLSTPARDTAPGWSPDGSRLVFGTLESGSWEIGVVELATGKVTMVTQDGLRNLEPSWHPNGKRIVFSSHRSGGQKLWSINADGTELVQLTENGDEDTHGRFSSDGRFLVFSANRRSKYDIYVYDLAKRTYRLLTPVSLTGAGEPCWLPDDSGVVYSANNGSLNNLWRTDFDTNKVSSVTHENWSSQVSIRH